MSKAAEPQIYFEVRSKIYNKFGTHGGISMGVVAKAMVINAKLFM